MKKLLATIIKEWILMRRDLGGLLLLLLMPSVLIVVMSLVQDAPFKDYQELKFDLLLADEDHGSVAQAIVQGLEQSHNFHIIDSINGQALSEAQLKQLLLKGRYKIGIVLPKGITVQMVNAANIITNSIAQQIGLGATLPTRALQHATTVPIYFDPTAKPAFRTAINFAIDKLITFSSTHILMQRVAALNKNQNSTQQPADFEKIFSAVRVQEMPLSKDNIQNQYINSVQHNVPAWAIFGMFFIVISISGHVIRERDEGSALRVGLIPRAYRYVSMGKVLFYTLTCTIQFVLMMCIGIWFMPLLGLPALHLGMHPAALLVIALCVGFNATTYGYFVASMFKTINQAMPFGAISIVILSAMGGIWVPVELLPLILQKVALISPLHWSLDAVEVIMLRDGKLTDVWLQLLILLASGILLWLISIYKSNKHYQSI